MTTPIDRFQVVIAAMVAVGTMMLAGNSFAGWPEAPERMAQSALRTTITPEPESDASPTTESVTPPAPKRPAPLVAPDGTYTVRPGDGLGVLAESLGVRKADLARVNNLDPNADLIIGQVLKIPGRSGAQNSTSAAAVAQVPVPAPAATPAPRTTLQNGEFAYTVRAGDSISSIAAIYGIATAELAAFNHVAAGAILHVGQVITVPNPFAAQVRALRAQADQLQRERDDAVQKRDASGAEAAAARQRADDVAAANVALRHDTKVLPWWRGVALTTTGAAILMLGVTALTVLEWMFLRRRFRMLVEMNDSLRRLDQKYKGALAKAELRLQQLYGRRRPGLSEGEAASRSAEEIEIERLNQHLRVELEAQLSRLGISPRTGARRSRWRGLFGTVAEPADVRSRR